MGGAYARSSPIRARPAATAMGFSASELATVRAFCDKVKEDPSKLAEAPFFVALIEVRSALRLSSCAQGAAPLGRCEGALRSVGAGESVRPPP